MVGSPGLSRKIPTFVVGLMLREKNEGGLVANWRPKLNFGWSSN